MKFISIIFCALVMALSVQASARDVQALYNKTCVFCHANGAARAPKSYDVEAWAPRVKKGMPTLVAHVKNGLGAMPPKGLCMDCSDAEYAALIDLMSKAK